MRFTLGKYISHDDTYYADLTSEFQHARIDIFVSGTIPRPDDPRSLEGCVVECDYIFPVVCIASEPRLVEPAVCDTERKE